MTEKLAGKECGKDITFLSTYETESENLYPSSALPKMQPFKTHSHDVGNPTITLCLLITS